ncbi:MAG TPA: sterol desaturase family protein [Rhizomicrobium sp.]|nr:sterol desaturase family protein [Rhizomicrobium sp.]
MKLAHDILFQILLTLWHVLPWLAGAGVVFAGLSHFSPCNQGRPWWKKRGLATDLAYWIFVPLFTRYLRIGVTVLLTIWLLHISDGQQIVDFYEHGHGPVSHMPLWLQAVFYLVASDFILYWIHRIYHRGMWWKYHAVHHASKDVEWTSASRFHPLNLALGAAGVDVAFLLFGISPDIFIVIGPFNVITSCLVHANLNWTFGPLRYLLASPVFHRWHHAADVHDTNFASTFSLWDFMFGTAYMPAGVLPRVYGIDDPMMPEGLLAQTVYPLIQSETAQSALAKPAV